MLENLYLRITSLLYHYNFLCRKDRNKGVGEKKEGFRQDTLPDLPQITFAIFSLKRKCTLGEAMPVAVRVECKAVRWLLGPGTSQAPLMAAATNQSNVRPGCEDC